MPPRNLVYLLVDITDDTFKDDVLLPLRLIWLRSEVVILSLLCRTI